MEEEQHHHLVFQNAYVRVFYVEIPAHESTLYHRHDLPYVSLPPPPSPDAPPPAAAPNGRPMPSGPRVSYALGGFSHAVNNTSDVTLRNIAIELLRPQGNARNRCARIVREQSLGDCDELITKSGLTSLSHKTLFETDEIIAQDWEIGPDEKTWPADEKLSSLVGGMSGIVNVIVNGDAQAIPQAGLVWLLPGSKTALEAGKDTAGHFITITFKDSAKPSSSE